MSLLKQSEEPVAWGVFAMVDGEMTIQYPVALSPASAKQHAGIFDKKERVEVRPLYAHPAQEAELPQQPNSFHLTSAPTKDVQTALPGKPA